MIFYRITAHESLSREGVMRLDRAGHGVVAGMYRKPEFRDCKFMYRIYNERVSVYRIDAMVLMEREFGPGAGSIIDAEWFRMTCELCVMHNRALKLNRAAADKTEELEKEARFYAEIAASDIFQNDIFVDVDDSGGIVQHTYRKAGFDDDGSIHELASGEET